MSKKTQVKQAADPVYDLDSMRSARRAPKVVTPTPPEYSEAQQRAIEEYRTRQMAGRPQPPQPAPAPSPTPPPVGGADAMYSPEQRQRMQEYYQRQQASLAPPKPATPPVTQAPAPLPATGLKPSPMPMAKPPIASKPPMGPTAMPKMKLGSVQRRADLIKLAQSSTADAIAIIAHRAAFGPVPTQMSKMAAGEWYDPTPYLEKGKQWVGDMAKSQLSDQAMKYWNENPSLQHAVYGGLGGAGLGALLGLGSNLVKKKKRPLSDLLMGGLMGGALGAGGGYLYNQLTGQPAKPATPPPVATSAGTPTVDLPPPGASTEELKKQNPGGKLVDATRKALGGLDTKNSPVGAAARQGAIGGAGAGLAFQGGADYMRRRANLSANNPETLMKDFYQQHGAVPMVTSAKPSLPQTAAKMRAIMDHDRNQNALVGMAHSPGDYHRTGIGQHGRDISITKPEIDAAMNLMRKPPTQPTMGAPRRYLNAGAAGGLLGGVSGALKAYLGSNHTDLFGNPYGSAQPHPTNVAAAGIPGSPISQAQNNP